MKGSSDPLASLASSPPYLAPVPRLGWGLGGGRATEAFAAATMSFERVSRTSDGWWVLGESVSTLAALLAPPGDHCIRMGV